MNVPCGSNKTHSKCQEVLELRCVFITALHWSNGTFFILSSLGFFLFWVLGNSHNTVVYSFFRLLEMFVEFSWGLPAAERVSIWLFGFWRIPSTAFHSSASPEIFFIIIYSVCLSVLESASSRETRFLSFSMTAPSCKEYLNMECNLNKTESCGWLYNTWISARFSQWNKILNWLNWHFMSQLLKSKQTSKQTKNLECSVTHPEWSDADLKLLCYNFPFLKQRNLSQHIFKNLIKMKLKPIKFSLHEQRDYVLCSLINWMFHSAFTSYNT